MAVCECSVTLKNTGTLGCMPIQDVARRLIMVPIKDSSNVLNRIDTSSIPSNTAIIALLNASDDKARYYPLPTMENVTNERAEPITEEFPSGNVIKIRDGVKTFTGQMIGLGSDYAGQIETFGCNDMGAFIVDAQGNLIGDKSVSGYLAPIPINKATWNVTTQDTGDTTVARINLTMQWKQSVKDSDIGMLLASDFASDVDWLGYEGLVDLYGGTPSSISTTGFTIPITSLFGSVANPQVVSNLASSDFEVYNETTTSVVTISTMTEDPAGTYAFTYVAQTSADEMQLRIASGTDGYDDTNLRSVTITTP